MVFYKLPQRVSYSGDRRRAHGVTCRLFFGAEHDERPSSDHVKPPRQAAEIWISS